MDHDQGIIDRFTAIRAWQRGDARAPHKPLVLLIALAQVQRGGGQWIAFAEVEENLRHLLEEFGPPRQATHPEYPFWRLQNDNLWVIPEAAQLQDRLTAAGDVSVSALREVNARGGFPEDVYQLLKARPALVNHIAQAILDEAFPASLHQEILDAVGFPWVVERRLRRDPAFRDLVLRSYERRCAVCGYNGRLGTTDLGLEAAHVKWHAAGGPDTVENGLALCSFHHVAFDRGAISADESLVVLVSQQVNGASQVEPMLLRFVGQPLRPPQRGVSPPALDFLQWHREQVFREPARQA